MHTDYIFICDYAEARDKVNALGIGFDTIFAPKVPARHPHFYVVIQLRFSIAEVGSKDVKAYLINADGVDVIPPITGKLEVGPPRPGSLDNIVRLTMGFGNVEFKEYGSYSVKVSVAGQEVASIPLRVTEPPKTA